MAFHPHIPKPKTLANPIRYRTLTPFARYIASPLITTARTTPYTHITHAIAEPITPTPSSPHQPLPTCTTHTPAIDQFPKLSPPTNPFKHSTKKTYKGPQKWRPKEGRKKNHWNPFDILSASLDARSKEPTNNKPHVSKIIKNLQTKIIKDLVKKNQNAKDLIEKQRNPIEACSSLGRANTEE